ncbi:MAG: hypothetical protein K6C05_10630 [Anaerovibrio sp.]|uniref:hypothetical protein n=1 Tax=Anaerovibrio sp. TaxID=1872532 RepID=UPI0025FB5647|nr:hypothetical protein [Anaerovibrio sp.]MCR5177285.1 hypothetical protein [Anaerovibrio sp.]
MKWNKGQLTSDDGMGMVELMVLLPVYMVLISGIFFVYGELSRGCVGLISYWQCVEEIRFIMDTLYDAVHSAKKITITEGNSMELVQCSSDGSERKIRYAFSRGPEKTGILYYNGQPISSLDNKKYVNIREIQFREISPYKVRIKIDVANGITGQEIQMDTVLYSYCIWKKSLEGTEEYDDAFL